MVDAPVGKLTHFVIKPMRARSSLSSGPSPAYFIWNGHRRSLVVQAVFLR
jgi:hypothetical protein